MPTNYCTVYGQWLANPCAISTNLSISFDPSVQYTNCTFELWTGLGWRQPIGTDRNRCSSHMAIQCTHIWNPFVCRKLYLISEIVAEMRSHFITEIQIFFNWSLFEKFHSSHKFFNPIVIFRIQYIERIESKSKQNFHTNSRIPRIF